MKIRTDKGTEFTAGSVFAMKRRGTAQLMMEIQGVGIAQAAQALEGAETITMIGDTPGVETVYTGYTRIAAMTRTEDGHVRITIAREE